MIGLQSEAVQIYGSAANCDEKSCHNGALCTRAQLFADVASLIGREEAFQLIIARMNNRNTYIVELGYLVTEQIVDESAAWLGSVLDRHLSDTIFRITKFESGSFAMLILGNSNTKTRIKLLSELSGGYSSQFASKDGELVRVTFNFGFGCFPDSGISLDEVFRKIEGTLEQRESAASTLGVAPGGVFNFEAAELHHAMNHNELELWFQPKVCLATKEVVGAEALVRWRHPEYGILTPIDFLGWFAYHQLSSRLDQWVIEAGFRQSREWSDAGKVIPLAINLDAGTLRRDAIVHVIDEAQRKYKVSPSMIEFEVTETMVIQRGDVVFRSLEQISARGYRIAIDDFGTGTNNIAYLTFLPADTLKLDRMFSREIETNSKCLALTKAAIDMAHAANLTIVAEGIETEEQAKIMHKLGCHVGQGYLFGRPDKKYPI